MACGSCPQPPIRHREASAKPEKRDQDVAKTRCALQPKSSVSTAISRVKSMDGVVSFAVVNGIKKWVCMLHRHMRLCGVCAGEVWASVRLVGSVCIGQCLHFNLQSPYQRKRIDFFDRLYAMRRSSLLICISKTGTFLMKQIISRYDGCVLVCTRILLPRPFLTGLLLLLLLFFKMCDDVLPQTTAACTCS
jgi:hypothetical protein